METKHTKGEWVINPRASLNVMCENKTIANCSSGQNGEKLEEEQANAKLIASAPDLLEALIKLYNAIDSCIDLTPELLKDCKNAIKKATA